MEPVSKFNATSQSASGSEACIDQRPSASGTLTNKTASATRTTEIARPAHTTQAPGHRRHATQRLTQIIVPIDAAIQGGWRAHPLIIRRRDSVSDPSVGRLDVGSISSHGWSSVTAHSAHKVQQVHVGLST